MTKLQPAPTELTVYPLLSMCVWLWRLKIWKMELRNIVTSAAGPSTHECMSALYNIHPLCVEPSSLSLLVVVLGHGFMTPPNLIYQTVFWPNFVISFVLPNFFFYALPLLKINNDAVLMAITRNTNLRTSRQYSEWPQELLLDEMWWRVERAS